MQQFTPITHNDIQTMSEMPKASILVWLKLRIYAGQNGKAYPTRSKIAEDLGLSIPSVNRAFQDLEKRSMITKINNHGVIKNAQYMIKNDQSLIRNDQSNRSKMISGSDQKRSVEVIKKDQQNKESNKENNKENNIACSKGNTSSFAFERAASSAADVEALDGSDERDLWLAELWAKHATAQGWISLGISKDFAMIKEGLEVIQIAKVVRKLDAYIIREQCNGMYQGKGWARKIRDRWCAKESKSVSKYDRKNMSESTIMIGQEKQQAEKEAPRTDQKGGRGVKGYQEQGGGVVD